MTVVDMTIGKQTMKQLLWVFTLSLTFAACSKEEPVAAALEDESVTAALAAAEEEVVIGTEAIEETIEVVEESAAIAEPEDKAIMLAQAQLPDNTPHNWQFKEGKHYTRLVPTQSTVGGADKIEVAEIFMYSCPHCMDLEDHINPWAKTKSSNVRFVRIPAAFNRLAQLHAQLYYTEDVLGRNGLLKEPDRFRAMVFEDFHHRGNRLASEDAIQKLFARGGVSADDFQRTWSSFEVNQKMRVAADLNRRYNVQSVPMVVVNGKYRSDAGSAGSYPKLIELIDELTLREGLR
jgi:thiol:disulfide interchange protein DsbA